MEVKFLNCGEVRMGSPYNICDLELQGDWVPELPEEDWQDLTATSPDGGYVALVAWDVKPDNTPAFKMYKIDLWGKSFVKSKPIEDCCQKVFWDESFEDFSCERL